MQRFPSKWPTYTSLSYHLYIRLYKVYTILYLYSCLFCRIHGRNKGLEVEEKLTSEQREILRLQRSGRLEQKRAWLVIVLYNN